MKATYYALTTTNYEQNGYYIVAEGKNRDEARNAAEAKIVNGRDSIQNDIYAQTELKNLIVRTKTETKKLVSDINEFYISDFA